jgi:Uma2 family endonuclease
MANQMFKIPTTFPSGEVVALDVSAEDFLTLYADTDYEWVNGIVIRIPSETRTHIRLVQYLNSILNTYFAVNPIGEALTTSYAMRLQYSIRTPDVIVILKSNPASYTEENLEGAADICIEIVSNESMGRDYGEKLAEYEQGGVKEYWIIDPARQTVYFHRLQPNHRYTPITPIENVYETPLLPKFRLSVPTLWQEPLPAPSQIMAMVRTMMEES